MRSFYFLPLSIIAMSFVSACSGPSSMPRGYVSYDQVYKSAPGAEASSIGYSYTKEQNDAVLKSLSVAAQDLSEKLDSKLSFSAEEIYLNTPKDTAFYSAFDHVLRDALTQRGYLLSTTAQDAVRVDVVVKDLSDTPCVDKLRTSSPVQIALAMDSVEGIPADYVDGLYTVPLYGFSPVRDVQIPFPPCALED